MIRFILNFILFGFIFFLLWRYFPQAFDGLFAGVTTVWDFIVNLFNQIVDKINQPHAFKDAL